MAIFPNPVEHGQTLRVSGNAIDGVVLCDLCGRSVLKANTHVGDDCVMTLPDDLAQGCYIVKVMRNGSAVRYEKLLVK